DCSRRHRDDPPPLLPCARLAGPLVPWRDPTAGHVPLQARWRVAPERDGSDNGPIAPVRSGTRNAKLARLGMRRLTPARRLGVVRSLLERPALPRLTPASVHATLRRHMLIDGYDIVPDLAKSRDSYLADARDGRRYLDFFNF